MGQNTLDLSKENVLTGLTRAGENKYSGFYLPKTVRCIDSPRAKTEYDELFVKPDGCFSITLVRMVVFAVIWLVGFIDYRRSEKTKTFFSQWWPNMHRPFSNVKLTYTKKLFVSNIRFFSSNEQKQNVSIHEVTFSFLVIIELVLCQCTFYGLISRFLLFYCKYDNVSLRNFCMLFCLFFSFRFVKTNVMNNNF